MKQEKLDYSPLFIIIFLPSKRLSLVASTRCMHSPDTLGIYIQTNPIYSSCFFFLISHLPSLLLASVADTHKLFTLCVEIFEVYLHYLIWGETLCNLKRKTFSALLFFYFLPQPETRYISLGPLICFVVFYSSNFIIYKKWGHHTCTWSAPSSGTFI